MRDDQEILELIQNIKEWHLSDIGYEIDKMAILVLLEEMQKERLKTFLQTRIGHLKNPDFFRFVALFTQDPAKRGRRAGNPTS